MEINNKVVVITGGAGGIGLAIAKAFLLEDPKIIVLADISFENFDFKNDKVINKKCNVSNQTDLNNLINDVNQEFGLIDIFCSNAGILSLGSEQSSNEDWDKNWNLHVPKTPKPHELFKFFDWVFDLKKTSFISLARVRVFSARVSNTNY